MAWINHIKLSNILLMVFAIPLIGALFGLGIWVKELQSEQTEARRTEAVLALSTRYEQLMSAIARERGLTASFLANASSNRTLMDEARQAVNQQIAGLASVAPDQFPALDATLVDEFETCH